MGEDWQVQSRQPCSAQVPHERATCFRSASRARKIRTPALLADPVRLGVVLDRDLVDLYPPERIRVFRLERVGELQDTTAGYLGQLFAAVSARLQLRGELVEASIRDRLPALVVDHGVAQYAIEPPDDGIADLATAVEASHEGVLHDLLGDRPVADAPVYEAKKLAVIRDQDLRYLRHDRVFGARGLIKHDICSTPPVPICQANVVSV